MPIPELLDSSSCILSSGSNRTPATCKVVARTIFFTKGNEVRYFLYDGSGLSIGVKYRTMPLTEVTSPITSISLAVYNCDQLFVGCENGDVLVYDIQDIGCRSFTYISTLGLAMEAAAENGKELIVLDRPNPLGGLKVEGNLVEDDCISFVSQFKIPYLYGLTCGELALMLNGERMLTGGVQCKLTVIKMKGWKRRMDYTATGLQWIPSSPHIPHPHSAFFYPVSGILGELGYMSIGVGYTIPFQMFAAPWAEADKLADALNALQVPGVIFRPIHLKPFYSVGKGEQLQGVQVHIIDYEKAPLSPLQFLVMQEVARLWPDRAVFDHADKGRFSMFDKVCGTHQIRERFTKTNRWEDIRPYWEKDVENFRKLSKKYYLYR